MTRPLLRLEDVSKHFGGFTAVADVSLQVEAGERFGLIGPNGSGKTTLINCVSGVLRTDKGKVVFEDQDISALPVYKRARTGIARTFQLPRPFSSMSVLENLMLPLEYVVHGFLDANNQQRVREEAMEVLKSVHLEDKANTGAGRLTQVDLRKLELARAIAARPRLLISDEAMAGLSGKEVGEILEILFRLNESGIAIIMIEHIMQAVMRFSQRIICLNAGRVICEGRPDAVFENPEVRRAYVGA
jgi:branched-chain amino acid transport system ATP-binding protein